MEKIIFYCLAIPILAFIFYLGGSAIMKGFSAKFSNRLNKSEESSQLGDEILKLNELFKSGALTQEEFDKAKKKLLND
jgi:hypothetical protein